MRARRHSPPLRTLVLLALVAIPAGCLGIGEDGADERLAQPVTSPIVVPSRVTPTTTGPTVNLNDPGYRMNGTWRVGDGWDYASDRDRVLRVRVVDQKLVPGGAHFLIEERIGKANGSLATNRTWVDGKDWRRVNTTEPSGIQERYQPGAPLRQLRNASVAYNVTRVDAAGRLLANHSVALYTRLLPAHDTILTPSGYVEARVVEQIALTRQESGVRSQENSTRWVHADYQNDVQFQLPSGETFTLTAARVGDFRRGTLAS